MGSAKAGSGVRVVARIVARPGRVEDLRAVLEALVAPTRAEEGCVQYDLLQNRSDPADFTFVEEWRDDAALDAHAASAHIRQGRARMADLTAVAPDVRRYTVIR